MNRGVLQQSSPVQQLMAAGSPSWFINNMRQPPPQQQPSPFLPPSLPPNFFPHFAPPLPQPLPTSWHDNSHDLPADSWSQLLLGGLVGEEDKSGLSHNNNNMQQQQQAAKKLENWEEQLLQLHSSSSSSAAAGGGSDNNIVKQENSAASSCYMYVHPHAHRNNVEFQASAAAAAAKTAAAWPHNHQMMITASSPKSSCVTTSLSGNMLDFSSCNNNNKSDNSTRHNPTPDLSSECNSTATGGAPKKARVQPASSTQSTFKVRKEKLGDRITALHQLVSPFGKTDTASVLLEAIGYIRFLQSQIEALSLPYLGSGSGSSSSSMRQQQQSVQGERNCLFPEDPGQLLNDNCRKRKGGSEQDSNEEPKKDLKSRGLCLVPVSCTLQVGSDNGADYWAPAALGGGFR